MTKAELVEKVWVKAGLPTKAQAAEAVDAVFDALAAALANGDSYTHTGFGSFSIQAKQERKGRNPRTGEEITIPARRAVRFTVGKALKEALNK